MLKGLLPDFVDTSLYVNRELSWIYFNQRVLEEAFNPELHPLLERVKFISIFSSNLDEYFMIRVAGIEEQYQAGIQDRTIDGYTPAEQLDKIRSMVLQQLNERNECFYHDLMPALQKEGIEFLRVSELSAIQQRALSHYFRKEIFPVLTPLAFDTGHPFPFWCDHRPDSLLAIEPDGHGGQSNGNGRGQLYPGGHPESWI